MGTNRKLHASSEFQGQGFHMSWNCWAVRPNQKQHFSISLHSLDSTASPPQTWVDNTLPECGYWFICALLREFPQGNSSPWFPNNARLDQGAASQTSHPSVSPHYSPLHRVPFASNTSHRKFCWGYRENSQSFAQDHPAVKFPLVSSWRKWQTSHETCWLANIAVPVPSYQRGTEKIFMKWGRWSEVCYLKGVWPYQPGWAVIISILYEKPCHNSFGMFFCSLFHLSLNIAPTFNRQVRKWGTGGRWLLEELRKPQSYTNIFLEDASKSKVIPWGCQHTGANSSSFLLTMKLDDQYKEHKSFRARDAPKQSEFVYGQRKAALCCLGASEVNPELVRWWQLQWGDRSCWCRANLPPLALAQHVTVFIY